MFRPLTPEQANLKEVDGWKVGQICQIKEYSGLFEIEGYHQYGGADGKKYTTVYLGKLRKDGNGKNGKTAAVSIESLLPIGAEQPDRDKYGLTAAEYAQRIFESGFAKSDWYNTDRQSLVKVMSISKTGRVRVADVRIRKGMKPRVEKVLDGQKIYSQEDYLLNLADLEYDLVGNERLFVPRLYNGEWKYWNGGQYITAPSMRMTWLLD